MTKLGVLLISVVAGAALATALAFIGVSVLGGSTSGPVNQTLYNYGTR